MSMLKEIMKNLEKKVINNPTLNDVVIIFNEIQNYVITREWFVFQGCEEGFNKLISLYTSNYFPDGIKIWIFQQGKQRNIIALGKKIHVLYNQFVSKLHYPEEVIDNMYLLQFSEPRDKNRKKGLDVEIVHSDKLDDIQKFIFKFQKQTLILLGLVKSEKITVKIQGGEKQLDMKWNEKQKDLDMRKIKLKFDASDEEM